MTETDKRETDQLDHLIRKGHTLFHKVAHGVNVSDQIKVEINTRIADIEAGFVKKDELQALHAEIKELNGWKKDIAMLNNHFNALVAAVTGRTSYSDFQTAVNRIPGIAPPVSMSDPPKKANPANKKS